MPSGEPLSFQQTLLRTSAGSDTLPAPASPPMPHPCLPTAVLPRSTHSYNLSRIFFGGFFIRGHPYTMETISFAIRFWSKVHAG